MEVISLDEQSLIAESTLVTDPNVTNNYGRNWLVISPWSQFIIIDSGINVVENGHLVSRRSDVIFYSVEAEYIDQVVKTYGPCTLHFSLVLIEATKVGAVVGGQTSCKAPEISAFEKYLPEDVEILPVHSLHGPNVDPRGQPLVGLSRKCIYVGVNPTSCVG